MEARLHGYQEYSVQWILDHPYAGLFLDMGLGKTLTTLTAVSDLLTVGEIENVLVIAPLKVAEKTWSDEIEKWDHLKHIRYSKILGSPKQREAALKQKADSVESCIKQQQSIVFPFKIRQRMRRTIPQKGTPFEVACNKLYIF